MRYLSVCSGIEAATSAWHHLGWEPVAFSEIEPFPSAVLKHHYPNVPNWGDMTQFKTWPDATIDLLVGGTPCQSFSVAGLRKGLEDPRGNLMLTFLGIADRYRPRYIVWENVPGVLSSNGGKDFGSFLGALGELGYGWAHRVLDAQWFGVAQRRRRVFVVGCLGDQRRAAAVLFESEGVSRNTPPSRAKGQGAAADVAGSLGSRGSKSHTELDGHGAYVPHVMAHGQANAEILKDQCPTLNCNHEQPIMIESALSSALSSERMASVQNVEKRMGNANVLDHIQKQITENHTSSEKSMESSMLVPHAFKVRGGCEGGGKGYLGSDNTAFTVSTHQDQQIYFGFDGDVPKDQTLSETISTREGGITDTAHAVAQPVAFTTEQTPKFNDDCALTLTKQSPTGGGQPQCVSVAMQVRRLTPVECERLQGFHDNFTRIPWKKKPAEDCPDGPRYKALGNSMAVPVMRWIGKRINAC